jgi:deazaflavin-dependent oxidoreductase (nitroreductase family)
MIGPDRGIQSYSELWAFTVHKFNNRKDDAVSARTIVTRQLVFRSSEMIARGQASTSDPRPGNVLPNSAVYYPRTFIQFLRIREVTLIMTNLEQPAGRRPSKLAAALQNAVTRVHRVLYRCSNGVIGGRVANSPVLLLTTTGRRSGRQRTVPLLYLMDGPNVVLVASNGGAVRHPIWWLNLQTRSEARIQIKGIQRRVKAEQASAAEKQRLWPRLTAMYPGYKRYQEITDRNIPVVILRAIEEDKSGND